MRTNAPAPGLLALYRPDIYETLEHSGEPSYRHTQVYEHLTRRPLRPFSEATALPADTRHRLQDLGASTLASAGSQTAADGTVKLLLRTSDGGFVETVMMPYQKRVTVCLSSQIGCPVGCAFCATGAMGFIRNLSVAEIVDQMRAFSALALQEGRRVSNLVFMGMGEPLLNLNAVLDSIRVLTDPGGINLAHRSVSVSTVGIPKGILRLARAEPQVSLALSLHASEDGTRARLIPKRHLHPLAEILRAAWEHFSLTHRRLMVEYVLLRGVNDSADDARRLARLLRGHVVTVNLLTWNPVAGKRAAGRSEHSGCDPGISSGPVSAGRTVPRRGAVPASRFMPSPPAATAAFREALLDAHIETVVRRSRGADIRAACGQLAGRIGTDPRLQLERAGGGHLRRTEGAQDGRSS